MGKASDAYNTAVSQAGPGLTTTALALTAVILLAARLLAWADFPSGDGRAYLAFSPGTMTILGLLLVVAVVVGRMGGAAIPLGTKTTLLICGVVGFVGAVCALFGGISALNVGSELADYGLGGNTFGEFLNCCVAALLCLGAALWAMAEAKNS